MARAHAILKKTSISKAVGDLLRSRVAGCERAERSPAGPDADFRLDPGTLLPVVRGDGRKLTTLDESLASLWPDSTCLIPI